jgi:GNAT superfamily N-acetyltransferase
MNPKPSPCADLALARRLERSDASRLADYARGFARLHPGSRAEARGIAGGVAVFTRADYPINRATALGLQGPVTREEVLELEAFYARHGVGPAVELCPLAHPTLRQLLAERGYTARRFLQVSYLVLGQEPTQVPAAPSKLTVSHVGPAEADTWVDTLAEGFGEGGPASRDSIDGTLARLAVDMEGTRLYFARWEGEGVAAAGLHVRDGVATLFGAATRQAFRGRGAQTALIQARLHDARALGCDVAVVFTSPEGGSLANEARAGFRVAYTRVLVERASGGGS